MVEHSIVAVVNVGGKRDSNMPNFIKIDDKREIDSIHMRDNMHGNLLLSGALRDKKTRLYGRKR